MRPASLPWMVTVLADTSFLEGLGTWARLTLQFSVHLFVGILFLMVPLIVVYGTMFILSKLAGRIRRGRSPR
ncbi:MAG TPA: hypothetical protein VFT45_22180 [Longimicrobium sp.]|nr:hypothetical protein [Longimicrobium sp.]